MSADIFVNIKRVLLEVLNAKQKLAHNLIVRAANLKENESRTESGIDVSRLQLLVGKGGAGKSHVTNAVVTSLKDSHDCSNMNFLTMAPTGKAATAINGSTIHSHKEGLGMAVKGKHKPLEANVLKHMQEKHQGKLKLVVFNEFTMVSASMLHEMDQRFRQFMCVDKDFRGVVVVVVGDPA